MTSVLKRGSRAGMVAMVLTLAACDFSVTNPGPVQDAALDNPFSHDALVAGAERIFASSLDRMVHHVGVVTREITSSGLIGGGSVGAPQNIRRGVLNDEETGTHWNSNQQARWLAEDALRRMERSLPEGASIGTYALAGDAHLLAAYANRLLGENMCEAVFDGGPAEPYTNYFTRAEQHFTDALAVATASSPVNTTLQQAALAGRASVRASLENWTGAMADAAGVPADFVYEIEYFTTTNNDWNLMAESNLNSPHRSSTVWNTFYEDNTDPRTPWRTVAGQPFGGPAPEGQIPWMPPAKYFSSDGLAASRALPIPVSSGREMDLLRAENELINGDFPAALAILNARRAALDPVQPDLTAADITEAWTVFKRERGIELWLEGRRLGDMRRWRAAGRPGPDEDMTDRSLCFPIPTGEKNTNPNL